MKNKIFILFFCISLISCTKQNPLEEIFYTSTNEYWQYFYSGKYSGPVYFKFNKNKSIDYVDIEKGKLMSTNFDQNIGPWAPKWSVSKDTILTWDKRKYDIVDYNDKIIILYYQGKDEPDGKIVSGFTYLVKGTIDNVRREPGYYGHKRQLHPEKYKE